MSSMAGMLTGAGQAPHSQGAPRPGQPAARSVTLRGASTALRIDRTAHTRLGAYAIPSHALALYLWRKARAGC
jgi:hypothetical protein